MKVVILKSNLKGGLSSVERAVGESSNLPVLRNVLLKTSGNKINISTTNLELAITKTISGKIIEEGGLTIPFSTLNNIVNNTTQERVSLEKDGDNFIFKTDNYEAKIQGLKEDEFPVIPKIKSENCIEFNPIILRKAINKVISAAQISEIRPEISGLLFDYQVTQIKLVATDSFRLAEKNISANQFKSDINHSFKVIVPLKTVQEVLRVFSDDEPIKLFIDDNQILFKNNNLQIISRLIDGEYPDYEQIIPKSIETELSVNKEHFINAVRLVSTFSGKNNDVNLALKNNNVMEVYLANQMMGENNYMIPTKTDGKDFENISFNWRYLIDGLKVIDSENLIVGVNGNNRPAVIKSADDTSHFYILMPIKA